MLIYSFFSLVTPGVPDAPEQPVIKDVTKDSAVVVWNKPYDGGKPITNYIVENSYLLLLFEYMLPQTWWSKQKYRHFG